MSFFISLISAAVPAHYLSSGSLLIQYIAWSCPDNESGMLRKWLSVGLVKVKKSIAIEASNCKRRGTPDVKLLMYCHGELDFQYLPKRSSTLMGKLLKPVFSHLATTWTVCIFSSHI